MRQAIAAVLVMAAAWQARAENVTTPQREPGAFAELFASMGDTIARYRAARAVGDAATIAELEPAIRLLDRAAAQRDAYASGLFWFTDLDAAVAEAQRTGRPILSLRLLGNLDEEYSCANSRFFRTVLYADETLGAVLRDRFVLHWQSVRPVPVVTIDMGDGRVLRRTITGNSAHYVLDARGRVVDVLPGLYAARTFGSLVESAAQVAQQVASMDEPQRVAALRAWHASQAQAQDRLWQNSGEPPANAGDVRVDGALPDALDAAPLAIGKSVAEVPVLRQIMPRVPAPAEADEAQWQRVAALYADDARLDEGSVRLMREKTIDAEQAGRLATSKRRVEGPLLRMVRSFEGAIAMDTARNEHLLHRQIRTWFASGQMLDDPAALNERVYGELFLTPGDDPWLGLAPADVYCALEGGGMARAGEREKPAPQPSGLGSGGL